jgi:two-component system sensor histidine kinase CiaH
MNIFKKNRLLIATIVYWFLLVYIAAGLVWWFIALEQQNRQMAEYRMQAIRTDDPNYNSKEEHIRFEKDRKTAQYTGEGSTFLILFVLGAFFVYLPVRRQIKLQEQQQNFMMAVTHELKTPIAVAKLNMETLLKYKFEGEKRDMLLRAALEETARLNTLASNILVSAQLEGRGHKINREALDFSSLTRGVALEFSQRYPDMRWALEIDPELDIRGDGLLLQMMVNNLLENAVKYSEFGGPVSVILRGEGRHILLQVADQGTGIPDTEKKKIFGKFYRVENEVTRAASGTGLGLWICRKIAADHGGRISVTDNSPGGSIFTITF